MNKFKYILAAALVGFSLSACDDDDTYGPLDDLPMLNRSVSIEDGASVLAATVSQITLDYNNLVGIDPALPITLNGQAVSAAVNPADGKQVLVSVSLVPHTDYTLSVPEGAVYRKDDNSVLAKALTVTFNTKTGINPALVEANLTNTNATAEAKAVYAMLKANYGTKQLSGAMGEVAWGTGFCDLIKQKSGKFPAIVGFDYIHLASSPSNWIDYGDITPVKTVWDNGSVPAVTWHWNVPTAQPGSTVLWTGEQVMPADWSGFVQINDDDAKAALANVVVGTVITVKTKDVNAGAQGSVKNGSTWGGLTSELEYFDITGDYSVTVTSDMLVDIKDNGIIISGHDYTATEVSFSNPVSGEGSYNASSDVFSAANVLVDGSWENQVAVADVAKLAGYLKLLQDANIPVLFRPFHEAAGDYTWGSWFWWGNSGVNTTKQLWSWLRNKLESEYGLNNLIWVWTVQTSDAGNLADMAKISEAYPGDNLVDIVGTDLYPDQSFSNQTIQFNTLNTLVNGKKMVALSECGNLVDVDSAIADGALWSYFMSWYEIENGSPAFVGWNTGDEWPTILNHPAVLNQGDLNL